MPDLGKVWSIPDRIVQFQPDNGRSAGGSRAVLSTSAYFRFRKKICSTRKVQPLRRTGAVLRVAK